MLTDLFHKEIRVDDNLIYLATETREKNQLQTNDVFSDKWEYVKSPDHITKLESFQKDWFLKLYGFKDEQELASHLRNFSYILDAGCGLGYKSAWFAKLAPEATVIGMDFSDSVYLAAEQYKGISNLYFVQGDIASTQIRPESIDFVVCDQVIMHTEHPEVTFSHLCDILKSEGQFCCYVYRKKALPRELLDSYFRTEVHNISKEDLWDMSEQLTILGKRLSELNVKIDAPAIPLLGIEKGEYDIQRFIYWNFLKCFWKEDWSEELNISTNFDWYSPSNAKRYNEEEFRELIVTNEMTVMAFHEEEACYSGRFQKG